MAVADRVIEAKNSKTKPCKPLQPKMKGWLKILTIMVTIHLLKIITLRKRHSMKLVHCLLVSKHFHYHDVYFTSSNTILLQYQNKCQPFYQYMSGRNLLCMHNIYVNTVLLSLKECMVLWICMSMIFIKHYIYPLWQQMVGWGRNSESGLKLQKIPHQFHMSS